MSKRKPGFDTKQMSLFDYLQQAASTPAPAIREGALDIAGELRAAICECIRTSRYSRWEICGRMSALLGKEVSKFVLDSWTAESKEGHRMPAEYLPAFCSACGDGAEFRRPVAILAERSGMFALPGPEALRAEIQRLAEDERKVRAEKRKRELFLAEMEKPGGSRP